MNPSDFTRRSALKRAAAAGLIAAPAASFLSACAASGDSDDKDSGGKAKGPKGEKSKKNPLAVDPATPLEVMIFDGGFGDQYAVDAEKVYKKAFPKAKIKHTKTQEIRQKLQPRFAGGTPPDLIDNSGAQQMNMAGLAGKGQLQDLTELLDAPSYDDPSKKVRDTLRPGVEDLGQFGGDEVYVINYAYTVFGFWYSQKLLEDKGWTYPKTWSETLDLCKDIKKEGIAPFTYAGKYPYYIHFTLFPLIAKIGGQDVMKKIDNLEPNAWKDPAVKTAAEMYHELSAKGYFLKGSSGMTHIQSQTAWTQGKAVFIPNGSWVENEARKTTPKDFDMTVSAPFGHDTSDKMPFGTLYGTPSEPFIVPSKAKNPRGGMEQLRIMLGKDSSNNFAKLVSSLTSLKGEVEGFDPPPGLKSASAALEKAGDHIVLPHIVTWYQKLEKEKIGSASGELLAGRIKPDEWVKRAQKAADETAKDKSVKKYKVT